MANRSNAIEVNGVWYNRADNAPVANARGRRRPTNRSRNWAQGQRSQPQRMVVGSMPIDTITWKSFPGEQWHEFSGFSFPDAWGSAKIAYASMRTELGKIKSLHHTTKVYSVMYGFTCKADGYAGFMDNFDSANATGPVAPNRIRVKAAKYCARQLVLPPGSTVADLRDNYNFVWEFDAAPAAGTANIISVTKFYVSTVPLPGIKPPPNFLVCEMDDK
ncbi:coat protein [Citrus leaf rugose virus]|uniref:Coat protein n=2 Tax=Citrus leaf rugose virus TaxID=37126 RepID=Q66106_9BROM|nr:coat protein [Citrus leaf rugose virus]AAC54058.1 coat protein [Citrus leaf rugose virus]prf//2109366D coat protein [Citrus leaf rugose virus]